KVEAAEKTYSLSLPTKPSTAQGHVFAPRTFSRRLSLQRKSRSSQKRRTSLGYSSQTFSHTRRSVACCWITKLVPRSPVSLPAWQRHSKASTTNKSTRGKSEDTARSFWARNEKTGREPGFPRWPSRAIHLQTVSRLDYLELINFWAACQ